MIPHDAVTAVAKHNFQLNYAEVTWADLADDVKAGWLEEAQAQCEAAAPFLRAQALAEAAELIYSLTDPDTCWFDHHGGCQAHGYLDLEPGQICPQHDAKEFVKTHGAKGDDASKD